ncbi:prepilin-type N-terminal cleavage/methylation domain-containing protein [candidate division WOR-3 bacterium]|nr:prepilin-type N-terminal cleavage/methylation domain-containing protein [candidate division WOR-3 bacterium]
MKKGFTIVELLVSITILAIGILSLGVLFPAGMRSTMLTKQNTQAIEYCQQRIEYLRTLNWNDTDLNAGTHGPDSLAMDNNDNFFILNYIITPDHPVPDMKRITVNVSWTYAAGTGGVKTRTRSIMTYICQ